MNININSKFQDLKRIQREFEGALNVDSILATQKGDQEKIEDDFEEYEFKN